MIKHALKEITVISDDEDINTENYLDSLNYLDNLYKVSSVLQRYYTLNDITFLPSFKGKYVVDRLGILSSDEENELKVFKIKSPLFLEDAKTTNAFLKDCKHMCSDVQQEKDIISIVLL